MGGVISSGLGLIGGLLGGGQTQTTPKLPQFKQTGKTTLADINSLGQNNVPAELLPQYRSLVEGLQTNPYSTQAQTGAGTAAAQGATTAQQGGQASSNLFGLTNSMIPYAQELGMAAFDPQQDLYNRTLQQTTDQQRVGQAARGVVNTPYGAGLENDALKNFNIDWQNNQLQRMLSGVQGLSGLAGSIGQGYNTAGGLGASASQLGAQASQLPYQTLLGQGQDQLTLLNALANAGTAANAVPQQQIQDYLQYLNAGNTANANATNSSGTAFNQNQTLGSGVGSALGGINWGSLFGGGASTPNAVNGYGLY